MATTYMPTPAIMPIAADNLSPEGEGAWTVEDPRGGRHRYEG